MTSICSALVIQVVSALLHGNWQDFNWHDALCGPLAIAELLVHKNIQISNQDLILPSLRPVTSLVLAIFRLLEWCSPWGSGIASRLACLETVFLHVLVSALHCQSAASVLPRVPWHGFVIFGLASALARSQSFCLCLASASGRLYLPAPIVYDTIQYETKWNRMFWLVSVFYDYSLCWRCKRVKKMFLFFRPQSPSAFPWPRGEAWHLVCI